MPKVNNHFQYLDGKVYALLYDPATKSYGEMFKLGGTESITLTNNITRDPQMDSEADQEGSPRSQSSNIITGQTTAINWVSKDITAENLALANLADTETTVQTAVVADTLTLVAVTLGTVRELGVRAVTNVIVKDSADLITYEQGVDYNLYPQFGKLEIIQDGNIVDGTDINITMDVPEMKTIKISAFTKTTQQYKLIYSGISNGGEGVHEEVVFPLVEVNATPSQNLKTGGTATATELSFEGLVLKTAEPIYYFNT